jgi:uncharacterized protein
LLIEHGAIVEARDQDRYPTLCLAAIWGLNIEIFRLLLKHAANLEISRSGWTALHEAVYHRHYHHVRLLIEQGADVNRKYFDGYPPICYAAQWDHDVEDIRLLLDSGADFKATNNDGWTPMREAVFHGRRQCFMDGGTFCFCCLQRTPT